MNQFQKSQAEKIRSCYETTDLEKGGEGSRGGKIIGYTKSGKAIYDSHNHEGHKDFSYADHQDAANAHSDLRHESKQIHGEFHENTKHHSDQSKLHTDSGHEIQSKTKSSKTKTHDEKFMSKREIESWRGENHSNK